MDAHVSVSDKVLKTCEDQVYMSELFVGVS